MGTNSQEAMNLREIDYNPTCPIANLADLVNGNKSPYLGVDMGGQPYFGHYVVLFHDLLPPRRQEIIYRWISYDPKSAKSTVEVVEVKNFLSKERDAILIEIEKMWSQLLQGSE